MAKNKHHYKWFITSLKTMSYIILAAVLIYEILNGVSKLNAKEMTYTSTTAVQQPIIYPTVTMCIMMDMTFHKPMSVNWVDPEKYNLSFPFENFGMVEDTFQNMEMKIDYNNLTVLENLGANYADFWTSSVQNIFGKPSKCYTYQPKWFRKIGFGAKMRFRMKVPKDPSISITMFLHNYGGLVPSIARIFGLDFSMIFVNPKDEMKTYIYEVSRTNMTELNSEESKCNETLGESHGNPGLIMSPEGPKTVEQCIEDHYHKNLNCQLPWAKNDTDLPICTSSEQYMKYRQLGENLSHASSDNYWDLIGCTPRCKFTKYKLKPMVEGTNDENKIMMKKPDGANIEFKILFCSAEIELKQKILIYDYTSLFADIGGYSGLLLGLSFFNLADMMCEFMEKYF